MDTGRRHVGRLRRRLRRGACEKKKPVRRRNPAPAGDDRALRRAAAALERFTGHEAEYLDTYVMPQTAAAWGLGAVAAIEYIATRDGETAIYRHEFAEHARPLLAASISGQQLYLLGGAYSVTDRGIVDD